MKLTRFVAATTAAVLLASALAACGDSGSAQSKPTSPGDETTETAERLTVWAWDPTFNMLAMDVAEEIYRQDHPGFELDVIEMGWDDIQTKITTLAMSKSLEELPDIFLIQNMAIQKNVANYPEVFGSFAGGPVDFSEFNESVVAFSTVGGENYAVPFDAGTVITGMRIDVLEEAGFTIDDFTDITWADYIKNGGVVLEKTGMPLVSTTAPGTNFPEMMLQSAGLSMFDAEGQPLLNTPEIAEILTVYKELVDSGVVQLTNSWEEYIGSFVNGSVAGVMQGVWIVGQMKLAEDQQGDWEITSMPKLEGFPGATNYSTIMGSSWAISSTGNQDLAQDFLAATFGGSVELYDTILPESGAVANWIPAGQSAAYKEPQPFFNGQPIFELVIGFGEKVPVANNGAYFYEADAALATALSDFLAGGDLTKALDDAQATVEFAIQ